MITSLLLARLFLVAGLLIGLVSWRETAKHVGDPRYLLQPAFPGGTTHAWFHAFREVCGDVAKMAVFVAVFFGPPWFRTPATWWITLALMLGYYAPFWIGKPFLPALGAPNPIASLVHVGMAALAGMALMLARSSFL